MAFPAINLKWIGAILFVAVVMGAVGFLIGYLLAG